MVKVTEHLLFTLNNDGPMLRAGLQEVHKAKLHVPSAVEFRPDRDRLSVRYELFVKAI